MLYEVITGCAGGIDTVAVLSYEKAETPANSKAFRISVSGLQGGHSGDDINKNRGNANKILNRFLWNFTNEIGIRLADFKGGNLRNAIAREAFGRITSYNVCYTKLLRLC